MRSDTASIDSAGDGSRYQAELEYLGVAVGCSVKTEQLTEADLENPAAYRHAGSSSVGTKSLLRNRSLYLVRIRALLARIVDRRQYVVISGSGLHRHVGVCEGCRVRDQPVVPAGNGGAVHSVSCYAGAAASLPVQLNAMLGRRRGLQ